MMDLVTSNNLLINIMTWHLKIKEINTMNITLNKITIAALTVLSTSFTSNLFAADISHSLRNTQQDNTTENYFELGLGLATGAGPTVEEDKDNEWAGGFLIVNGSYNWRGFFIEKFGESTDPLVLGYNAYSSDNWSFDIVLAPKGRGIQGGENDRFHDLDDRDSATMFGGRLTGYIDDNIVQFSVKHNVGSSHNGTTASALIGRNWQVRNWNFHGMTGVQFFDAKLNDYYLGISAEEAARTDFNEYSPGSNFNLTAEVGVTYPITEDWVFRSTARFAQFLGDKTDSPIFVDKRDNAMSLSTSISYVF